MSNLNDDITNEKTTVQNKVVVHAPKKSSNDLNAEIKLIEKKIKQCQKKIHDDKRKKYEGTPYIELDERRGE